MRPFLHGVPGWGGFGGSGGGSGRRAGAAVGIVLWRWRALGVGVLYCGAGWLTVAGSGHRAGAAPEFHIHILQTTTVIPPDLKLPPAPSRPSITRENLTSTGTCQQSLILIAHLISLLPPKPRSRSISSHNCCSRGGAGILHICPPRDPVYPQGTSISFTVSATVVAKAEGESVSYGMRRVIEKARSDVVQSKPSPFIALLRPPSKTVLPHPYSSHFGKPRHVNDRNIQPLKKRHHHRAGVYAPLSDLATRTMLL